MLALLSIGGERMHKRHVLERYIDKAEAEIAELVEREAVGLSLGGEEQLHLLFENLEHAKACLKMYEEKGPPAAMRTV